MPLVVVVWSFPCDDECTGLLSRCQPALVWALRWCSIHGARVLLGLAAVAPPKVFTVKPTGTPQHAACPSCLHEDGGPDVSHITCVVVYLTTLACTPCVTCASQAVFEETDPALSVTLSAGVQLGPTFRVVACNCARMCDTVGDMCPFCVCKCRECGGSAQRRPLSTPQYDDDDGDDGTASPNVAISWRRMLSDHSSLMLVCVAAGLALYVLPHPHLLTVTIPAISILFCGALW